MKPALAPAALAPFVEAGVLAVADVQVACALARLCSETDTSVLLAAALAVRGPRLGHVCIDLRLVATTVTAEGEDPVLDDLPWPDAEPWLEAVRKSSLVGTGVEDCRPLVLQQGLLYLERYWHYEDRLATMLLERAKHEQAVTPGVGDDLEDRAQAEAIRCALSGRIALIAGGPGTGKTTTVARMIVHLASEADPPLVALVAPTGKAAARMNESIARALPERDVDSGRIRIPEGSTIHRLLRRNPGSNSRFLHDARNPLPHDLVVVDESSMVSLPLMTKLLDAVRPDARVVLVGDPDQLASIEAGAVIGDIVQAADAGGAMAARVVRLRTGHRFEAGSRIALLADAIRAGDADETLAILGGTGSDPASDEDLVWIRDEQDLRSPANPLRQHVLQPAQLAAAAAERGDAAEGLAAMSSLRVLCAHRRGRHGVSGWNDLIESWIAGGPGKLRGWYLGRPVLVTRNDYRNNLFSGDMGLVIAGPDRLEVAFGTAEQHRRIAVGRLGDIEMVHAMTIHKSQGSEFDRVVLVLPDLGSRLLTRELLYTGATRAKEQLVVYGAADRIAEAVSRRAARASGLRVRLL